MPSGVSPRPSTSTSRPSVSHPTRTHPPVHTRLGPDFMTYPYPDTERVLAHLETLPCVKDETKQCITNLLNYRAMRMRARFPRTWSAAVLVPLFVGRSGELYVVLSRRTDTLRAFAGDTALPGGKMEPQDRTVEETAVGLPHDKERLPLLCVMEPLLAKGEMLVTPVVVLIADHGLQPHLNSSEVVSIFAHPLISFLSSKPKQSNDHTTDLKHPFYTYTDIPFIGGTTYRLHSFRTGHEAEGVKPIMGLTALILIKTASIGYERTPDFEVHPFDTRTLTEQIAYAILTVNNPMRKACAQEGIDVRRTVAQLMRPSVSANMTRAIEWAKIGAQWKRLMEDHAATAKSAQGRDREQEHQDAIPDVAALGELLDELRDVVNGWMEELKGDEKKLAKAKEAYPKIMEEVIKAIKQAQNEGSRVDAQALFAFVSKERQGGLEGDSKSRDQSLESGQDGDRNNLEQAIPKGCGAKL
ncbi:hypothetical protein JVU11DRAFT_2174 [Chiua virens]|nr:hypothetical protein JVU11DRAFT_2174 [Chiua virens]